MRRALAALMISALLPCAPSLADVYRSVDAQGHVQYSDTPTPGATLLRLRNAPSAPAAPTPTTARTAPAPVAGGAAPADPIGQQLAQEAAARAVKRDLAETREQDCKKAKETYQQLIDAPRIFKTGENGERQYVTDDEANQMRTQARLAVDKSCGS